MRSKIVQLVLELTTLADAPPELLEKHSLASIMRHYLLESTDVSWDSVVGVQHIPCFTA
jgi:hypothetical protein